jgi:hypothetical protein
MAVVETDALTKYYGDTRGIEDPETIANCLPVMYSRTTMPLLELVDRPSERHFRR